jgi:hypothetical protein
MMGILHLRFVLLYRSRFLLCSVCVISEWLSSDHTSVVVKPDDSDISSGHFTFSGWKSYTVVAIGAAHVKGLCRKFMTDLFMA